MGGGGSSQQTSQMSSVANTSTTDASKHYNFDITQTGLSPEQTTELLHIVNQTQGQALYTQLAAGGAGVGPFSSIVLVVILIILAALIFR